MLRSLLDPGLPLTTKTPEAVLHHRAIARRSSFGARSEQGSYTSALFAGVIDTCRTRKASAWHDLIAAIIAGRQRLTMPALPTRVNDYPG